MPGSPEEGLILLGVSLAGRCPTSSGVQAAQRMVVGSVECRWNGVKSRAGQCGGVIGDLWKSHVGKKN